MRGAVDRAIPDDYANIGLAFELAMAELWRLENPGWKLSPGEVQYVGGEYGFPYVATLDRRASRGKHRRAVEFKTARNLEEWGDPSLDGDCPADYAAQVISQMLFAGESFRRYPAHLLVLGPFFRHHTYEIGWDERIATWIIRECQRFWKTVQAGVPPELDDSVSTYNCVRELHPDIAPGVRVEIPEALAQDWRSAAADASTAERSLRGLKTKVLDAAGSAQFVTVNGVVVAQRQPHARGGVALVLKGSKNGG